ncbi:MAG: nicotinamide-nucleotide amidohydrolase family protein [Rhodocyclaceae bacterium]|nr:nicotinamide-nucleotide amidohydrolase family protein [Rhodocyclaceae bacterium]
MDCELDTRARRLGAALCARGWLLATAESCTGGWVAEAVTSIGGSSTWFERGYVTYSNRAKQEMLGVAAATLAEHGAVSLPVVREMLAGALANAPADLAVAVSGVAGPSGGTPDKPVGMVCVAWGARGQPAEAALMHFAGDREAVRRQTVLFVLETLADYCARGRSMRSA